MKTKSNRSSPAASTRLGADPAVRVQGLVQPLLARDDADQLDLGAGEVDGGRDDEEVVHVGTGGDHRLQRRSLDQQVVGRGHSPVVGHVHRRGGVALRVEVDDQDALAELGQRGRHVDGRRGLADPALLVGDDHDAGPLRPAQRRSHPGTLAGQQHVLGGLGQRRRLAAVGVGQGGRHLAEVPRAGAPVGVRVTAMFHVKPTPLGLPRGQASACGKEGASCGRSRSPRGSRSVDNPCEPVVTGGHVRARRPTLDVLALFHCFKGSP